MSSESHVVLVPMKLDAFVLNDQTCKGPSKLAALQRPDYKALRAESEFVEPDVMPPIDVFNSAEENPRLHNPGTGEKLKNRPGIYLHWVMPQCYRHAVAATEEAMPDHAMGKLKSGFFDGKETPADLDKPEDHSLKLSYRACPNRFFVVRCMKVTYKRPDKSEVSMEVASCYVVCSDRVRFIGNIPFSEDLDVESSPFLDPHVPLDRQAEVFLGLKQKLEEWEEDELALRHTPLTIIGCSNPYFTDCQPQNTGVFSIHDDISYHDGTTLFKDWTSATVLYHVLGWHTDLKLDPFHLHRLTADLKSPPTNKQRLSDCFMELTGGEDSQEKYKDWLKGPVSGQVLCHGSIYGVQAFYEGTRTGGDRIDRLQDSINQSHPIAVGATSLDALFAWLDVQQAEDPTATQSLVVQEILALQALLLAREEDPDGQATAEEQLSFDHYHAEDGEAHFHFSAAEDSNATEMYIPSEDILAKLETLNDLQKLFDAAVKEIGHLKWELFAEWWKAITFKANIKESAASVLVRKNNIKTRVAAISNELSALEDGVDGSGSIADGVSLARLGEKIQKSLLQLGSEQELLKAKVSIKTGTGDRFYLPKDPTVLVGGVPSGWPSNFDEPLPVRLEQQAYSRYGPESKTRASQGSGNSIQQPAVFFFPSYDKCFDEVVRKMPTRLQEAARYLVTREFPTLQWIQEALENGVDFPPAYFADGDRWYEQPLCPLFVEWEVEYHHIDFEHWEFIRGDDDVYRYYLKKDKAVASLPPDVRIISGRSMVTADAQLSLQKSVKELLDTTPETTAPEVLSKYRTQQDEKDLLKRLSQIDYFSSKLDGFRSQLITRTYGTHIKPSFLAEAENPGQPLLDRLWVDFGINRDHLGKMDSLSETTPFASLRDIAITPEQSPFSVSCPFKPVSHGQFRFTKYIIVDKFGQVLTAPNPLHPCTSAEYSLNRLALGGPNTVDGAPANVENEFVQIPPSINQPARWNSEFMVLDEKRGAWRPTGEYENPIWGWLMVDYTDKSIQVFRPDGQFYVEIGLYSGGQNRVSIRTNLPEFNLPAPSTGLGPVTGGGPHAHAENIATGSTQLDAFLRQLLPSPEESMPILPFAIFSTMSKALEDGSLAIPRNNLTDSLPVSMGRPIALVNSGWSLELSSPPYENESTIVPGQPTSGKQLLDYSFPLKLGDGFNRRDGLIGYFKFPISTQTVTSSSPSETYEAFDYKHLYTYFKENDLPVLPDQPVRPDPRVIIGTENLPTFKPFYVHPSGYGSPEAYHSARSSQLQVFATLVDPFAPVNGFSGILPISPLSLPSWTLERALKNLTASIRVGPTLLPVDLPAFRLDRVPTSIEQIADVARGELAGTPCEGLPIPAMANGQWAWMQPYPVDAAGGLDVLYNAYRICPNDVRPRLDERSLLCVVEGYLELTKPMSA